MGTLPGFIAILMWGLLALLGSQTTSIPAFKLLFICFSISALIMFGRRLIAGKPLLQWPAMTAPQWLIGTTGLFGFHLCYFLALKQAPVLEVSLIVYLWPLLLALFVAQTLQRGKALLGGALGFAGIVVLLAAKGPIGFSPDALSGYLLALLCALIWSGYSAYLAKAPGEIDDIGWLSLLVALLSLAAHMLLEGGQLLQLNNWQFTPGTWLGAVMLGLGPVGGAFYLWDRGLKQGNRQLLASLSFSAPLISSVALVISGQENPSSALPVTLALILLGGWIANRPQRGDSDTPLPTQIKRSCE